MADEDRTDAHTDGHAADRARLEDRGPDPGRATRHLRIDLVPAARVQHRRPGRPGRDEAGRPTARRTEGARLCRPGLAHGLMTMPGPAAPSRAVTTCAPGPASSRPSWPRPAGPRSSTSGSTM